MFPNCQFVLNEIVDVHQRTYVGIWKVYRNVSAVFTLPVANLINNLRRNLQVYSHNMGYFQVKYDSRVVNYNRRGFIILTTGLAMTFIFLQISNILEYS